jgi:hypothetical protein
MPWQNKLASVRQLGQCGGHPPHRLLVRTRKQNEANTPRQTG